MKNSPPVKRSHLLPKTRTKAQPKKQAVAIVPEQPDEVSFTSSGHMVKNDVEYIFRPHLGPQTAFLEAGEFEVLHSGGRGSAKSHALIADMLHYVHHPDFKGLLLRKMLKDLEQLIERCKSLFFKAVPGTKWREQDKKFIFPAGGFLWCGYFETDADVERYQGLEFSWLGIDEVCQLSEEEPYQKLLMSIRSSKSDIKKCVRLTANPSGVGKHWVKARFIDPAPLEKVEYIDEDSDENFFLMNKFDVEYNIGGKVVNLSRKAINSTVFNNPSLKRDPQYIAQLQSLGNENLRRQWLDGDWDADDGLAFSEFSKKKHICDPFPIPHYWKKFRAADWGFSSRAACLWFAVDPRGTLYVYREYGATNERPEKFAENILFRESEEDISYGVLDASAWDNRGATSPALTMIRAGCHWRPADNKTKGSRSHGKMLVHHYLADDVNTAEPRLKIFSTCRELIKELSTLPLDPKNTEDVDTDAPDHCFVAGTLVDTPQGQIPIELLPSDKGIVFSVDGREEVYYNRRLTRKSADVVTLTFADGKKVTCTPDHKFWSQEGWVSASDMLGKSYTNVFAGSYPCARKLSVRLAKFFRAKNIFSVGNTFRGTGLDCTEKSGKKTSATSPKGSTFITLMGTEQTTPQRIWKQCLTTITCLTGILTFYGKTGSMLSSLQKRVPQSGTEAKLEETGTGNSMKGISTYYTKLWASCAKYAGSLAKKSEGENFAVTPVSLGPQERKKTTTRKSVAWFARRVFCATNMESNNRLAAKNAQQVCVKIEPAGKADVYCLTVPKTGCFSICGGILVKNCYDAMRYGLASRPVKTSLFSDRGRLIRPQPPVILNRKTGY